MISRRKLRSLLRSEKGSVAIVSAVVMVVMIGFAAIAVDVGSTHYDKRKLQGAADLAAIAAVTPPMRRRRPARPLATMAAGRLTP